MFAHEDIYFLFLYFFFFQKKKKKKKTFKPYPNLGTNETIRDNNSHMVSILSLNVQDSFIATVSCRLQENIHLEAHFLVGVQIDPSKKKKKKKKQRSTVVKLLVAEYAVKVH